MRFTTRYAALRRSQALLVLAGLVGLGLWFQLGAASPKSRLYVAPANQPVVVDRDLYRAIVDRVRSGQDYYVAVAHELRAGRYPLKPASNFRQPTSAWLLSALPSLRWATLLQAALAALAVLLTHRWLTTSAGARVAWRGAGLVAIAFAGLTTDGFPLFQETWAGLLIFLSFGLFALGRWRWALVSSFAALAFREFALLPCGVGLLLAVRGRRWREAGVWLGGLGVYAALMLLHLAEAARHILPDDEARSSIGFGGSAFIVLNMQFTALMGELPRWAVAVLVPLGLLGLAGWRDGAGGRLMLVCFGYVAAFSVIGLSCNNYWGAIYAPLVYLGLAFVPESLRDLARALRAPTPPLREPQTVAGRPRG